MKDQLKSKINKRSITYVITVLVSIILIYAGHNLATSHIQPFEGQDTTQYSKAEVVTVESIDETTYANDLSGLRTFKIVFTAELKEGPLKGQTVAAIQTINPASMGELDPVEVGDKVLLNEYVDTYGDTGSTWQMVNFVRLNWIIALGILFLILLIIFGRAKGVHTMVSLAFTASAIFLVFVPSILAGINIYLLTIALCVYIIVMNMLILNGPNKKSLVAGAGCAGGVLIAAILSLAMQGVLHLTGLTEDAMINLSFLGGGYIDLNAIIFAAIIIGSLGAVMDVAISIASSLHEITLVDEHCTVSSLTKSGLNIGRDMMGTMSNTLILAYIGSSLATILTLTVYDLSTSRSLNREFIIVELLQTLVGSIGLLITIPLTTILGAVIYKYQKKDKNVLQK